MGKKLNFNFITLGSLQLVMIPVGRVLAITKKGLSKPLKFSSISNPNSSNPPPLLFKLLQASNSSIKSALDLEANSTLTKDSFPWEYLITSLRSSSPQKAQLVLEWKLDKLLESNEREQNRYCELIYLCGKIQNVQFALQVFTLMEAHGVMPTCAIFNSLISACLSSDIVITALSLFEIMQRSEICKPNSATYNAFISIYSKLGDTAAMQVWYTQSKMAGFPPTVQTFEYLISGSIRSQEIDSADKFHEEMLLSGITPSMCILENMLEGLCQQKKLSKIKEFLKFIHEGGWNMNELMVNKLLLTYSVTGKVDEMEELLLIMKTNQDPKVLSQVHCGIIKMYALSDRLDDLEFSVGRMLKQGMSFTCADDVEKAISSYFRCGAYERLNLFLERIHGSYKLTRSTYDLLVAGYRRAGLSDRLDLVVRQMTSMGL